MHSPTRSRFLEKKAQKRKERKREEGMVVCRGTIRERGRKEPCEYALYPRDDRIGAVITCHRCHTGMVMTSRGWKTFAEDAKLKGIT